MRELTDEASKITKGLLRVRYAKVIVQESQQQGGHQEGKKEDASKCRGKAWKWEHAESNLKRGHADRRKGREQGSNGREVAQPERARRVMIMRRTRRTLLKFRAYTS